jgi:hypothetical protein
MRSATALLALVFILLACGSGPGPNVDAGVTFDGGTCCPRGTPPSDSCGPVTAGGFSAAGNGGCKQKTIPACRRVRPDMQQGCPIWVVDMTGYTPDAMHAPRAPAHACTMQQIADFASCNTGDASKCDGADASNCAACLTSDASDTTWGPLVHGTITRWNAGGCVDVVLGQEMLEPESCGAKSTRASRRTSADREAGYFFLGPSPKGSGPRPMPTDVVVVLGLVVAPVGGGRVPPPCGTSAMVRLSSVPLIVTFCVT